MSLNDIYKQRYAQTERDRALRRLDRELGKQIRKCRSIYKHRVHALRENGWVKCGTCSTACSNQSIPTNVVPDRIVFNEHFKVSTTIPIVDRLKERYGKEGVVVTDVQPHEPLREGQLLVGINNRALDNYGNFVDNQQPYFTAFKNCPGKEVTLNIATLDKTVRNVPYTFTRMSDPPRIHSPGLHPFEPQVMFRIGGLTITQMNAEMAKAYPEYLKAPMNNSVVGVVVQVAALSPEWNVQEGEVVLGAHLEHGRGKGDLGVVEVEHDGFLLADHVVVGDGDDRVRVDGGHRVGRLLGENSRAGFQTSHRAAYILGVEDAHDGVDFLRHFIQKGTVYILCKNESKCLRRAT